MSLINVKRYDKSNGLCLHFLSLSNFLFNKVRIIFFFLDFLELRGFRCRSWKQTWLRTAADWHVPRSEYCLVSQRELIRREIPSDLDEATRKIRRFSLNNPRSPSCSTLFLSPHFFKQFAYVSVARGWRWFFIGFSIRINFDNCQSTLYVRNGEMMSWGEELGRISMRVVRGIVSSGQNLKNRWSGVHPET